MQAIVDVLLHKNEARAERDKKDGIYKIKLDLKTLPLSMNLEPCIILKSILNFSDFYPYYYYRLSFLKKNSVRRLLP